MDKFDIIKSKFFDIKFDGKKVVIDYTRIRDILMFLKSSPELSYDTLFTIVAVDNTDYIELIYPLVSTYLNDRLYISTNITDKTSSVADIYASAYYDECEIYDLFGVSFEGNKKLRRLLMPESWHGYPLRKDYQMNDERLNWNA